MSDLTIVVNSHEIECLGVEKDEYGEIANVWYLGDDDIPEPVIVRVFKDGLMLPSCRCYSKKDNMCHAAENKEDYAPCCFYAPPRG